jgi:nucleoside 2-deoxyribosyltransferase
MMTCCLDLTLTLTTKSTSKPLTPEQVYKLFFLSLMQPKGNQMKNYVYLAGPMEDCSVDHMTGWREEASLRLNLSDIDVLDPTRRVSFHDQLGDNLQNVTKTNNICNRIFKQDLQDIAHSRIVLADVRRGSGRGTGTSMELMFAHTKNKIIILWADEEDFVHPFYEAMATEKHYNLEDAIEAIQEYY